MNYKDIYKNLLKKKKVSLFRGKSKFSKRLIGVKVSFLWGKSKFSTFLPYNNYIEKTLYSLISILLKKNRSFIWLEWNRTKKTREQSEKENQKGRRTDPMRKTKKQKMKRKKTHQGARGFFRI